VKQQSNDAMHATPLTLRAEEQDKNMNDDSVWRYRLCFLDETDSLFYISEKVRTPARHSFPISQRT
jgi:hypothetical protein